MKEEMISKLSQLDRIEYRQLDEKISKAYPANNTISAFWISLILMGFIVLFFLGIGNFAGKDVAAKFLSQVYPALVWFFPLYIILMVLFDSIDIYNLYKNHKKLNERFFEIKVRGTNAQHRNNKA